MRIYLVIVLLYFITATKSKNSERVKSKGHSSKKQSSVSKNKGKEVEREEGSGKTGRKERKLSKKSSSGDKKEKRKAGKTKEKKKSKKKKTKKRESELEEKRSGEVNGKETNSEEITPNPDVTVISPAIIQNDRPASSESPSSYTQKTLSSNTEKREGASEELKSEKTDVTDTKSQDLNLNPLGISPVTNQIIPPVSSKSPSLHTQTTLSSNTLPKPRSPKPPITTDFQPSSISSILASINRNKSIVNRTT